MQKPGPSPLFLLASLLVVVRLAPSVAVADVAVIANRTPNPQTLRIADAGDPERLAPLAAGEVIPVFGRGPMSATVTGGLSGRVTTLAHGAPYLILQGPDGAALTRIGLVGEELPQVPPQAGGPGLRFNRRLEVRVKLLADEEEATVPAIWQAKLRRRLEDASAVVARHCGVEFRLVAFDSWRSDDAIKDFTQSLAEFERQIDPAPATLAIGFTSQYEAALGRTHLGGTRGPSNPHILLREWSQHLSERERMEILLHELGHYLGASHSPEPTSVMRPVLGDRKSRRADFVIRFDPLNALAMSLAAEEYSRLGINRFGDLTPATRYQIGRVYQTIAQTLPDDATAQRWASGAPQLALVSPANAAGGAAGNMVNRVLAAMLAAQRQGPLSNGDEQTQRCLRAAAAAAAPMGQAGRQTMLVALGMALGDPDTIGRLPVASGADLAAAKGVTAHTPATLSGRADLAKHFFASAALAAVLGAPAAHSIGLAKEVADSEGGTGFSFVDLAADRAGVGFAQGVLAGRYPLEGLASRYRPGSYFPSTDGLPEGIDQSTFARRYGGPDSDALRAMQREIDRRIAGLPPNWAYSPAAERGSLAPRAGTTEDRN